jgi:hypothetical protein
MFNQMEKLAGGTVQMGRIQPACFGWPGYFGLVAHHGRTGEARSANGDIGGGPAGSGLPAAGGAWGAALGRHDDVLNSIRGQRGGVAHQGGCSTVVGGRP